jgi:biotin carboxylase
LCRKLPIGEQERVRFITNDEYCVELCARLNGSTGERRLEVKRFSDKFRMAQTLTPNLYSVPNYSMYDEAEFRGDGKAYLQTITDYIGFPMICRPLYGTHTSGAKKMSTEGEFVEWAQSDKFRDRYLVQEFIEGTMFHGETIVVDGRFHHLLTGRYLNPLLQLSTGLATGSIILHPDDPRHREFAAINAEILQNLSPLRDRVTHLELMEATDGRMYFIDIVGRAPGAAMPDISEAMFGCNLERTHLRLQMGGMPKIKWYEPRSYYAWVWLPMLAKVEPDIGECASFVSGRWLKRFGMFELYELILRNEDYGLLELEFQRFKNFNRSVAA